MMPPFFPVDNLSKVDMMNGTYEGQTFTIKKTGISVLLVKSIVYQCQPMNSQFLLFNLISYTNRVKIKNMKKLIRSQKRYFP